jgi:2-keto-4-pentenoate hydratase
MTTQATTLLLEARRSRMPLAALPESARPTDAAAAYAIQDEVLAALGGIGGWKVGAANPSSEPGCSPLPAAGVVRSGHAFAPAAFRLNGLEAEIAFTIAHDLPPLAAPYTADDLLHAIAAVHPAIEIVDSRFVDMRAVDPLSALADFGSHGALAFGPGRTHDLRVEQSRQRVVLEAGGKLLADNVGGNAAGDVFRLLAWLANHAAARCGGLRAGQVITTGSCTGLTFAHPPVAVRADLAGIGACEIALG